MNNAKSVCVVIPSNRIDSRLLRCIKSVLFQNYKDIHINVVLNGEINPKKLAQFEALFQGCSRISIFFLRKARNANEARNFGKKISVSDYIAYLDADDWWDPNFLSNVLRTSENVEGDIFYSGMRIHYKNKVVVKFARCHREHKTILDYLMSGGVAPTSGLLERRRSTHDLYWDQNLNRHQDYDYLLRAQLQGFDIKAVEELINYDSKNKSGKIPFIGDALRFTLVNFRSLRFLTFLRHMYKLVKNSIKYL